MATGRPRTLARCLALGFAVAAAVPPGCSSNPFTSRQTTVGGLKASVSQLEFENEKLRKEVGELKADNARLDNQLVQERDANGEIAARLDDAKDLLRRQGGGPKSFEDDVPPPVATPKPRRVKNNRTPPAASIPAPDFGSSPGDDVSLRTPSRPSRDLGDDDAGDDRWLPVARGLAGQVPARR